MTQRTLLVGLQMKQIQSKMCSTLMTNYVLVSKLHNFAKCNSINKSILNKSTETTKEWYSTASKTIAKPAEDFEVKSVPMKELFKEYSKSGGR